MTPKTTLLRSTCAMYRIRSEVAAADPSPPPLRVCPRASCGARHQLPGERAAAAAGAPLPFPFRSWQLSHPGDPLSLTALYDTPCGDGGGAGDEPGGAGAAGRGGGRLGAGSALGGSANTSTTSPAAAAAAGGRSGEVDGAEAEHFWRFYYGEDAAPPPADSRLVRKTIKAQERADEQRRQREMEARAAGAVADGNARESSMTEGKFVFHGGTTRDACTMLLVAALAGCAWCCSAAAGRQRGGRRGGAALASVVGRKIKYWGTLLLLGVAWTDAASGFLHVVLDNPRLNT